MTASPNLVVAPMRACWSQIGISGDRTCPELSTFIHCRNCPVFSSAARSFFDRPAPEGYLREWTHLLASQDSTREIERVSVVVFRLYGEWLALTTNVVAEVTPVRPVHRIPHRTNHILAGLVNLRGQLFLCASLHGLLGADPNHPAERASDDQGRCSARAGMVLIRQGAEQWVFTADEVAGVEHWPRNELGKVPSTLANPTVSFSRAVFHWGDRIVGILEESRVFSALRSVVS